MNGLKNRFVEEKSGKGRKKMINMKMKGRRGFIYFLFVMLFLFFDIIVQRPNRLSWVWKV